MSRLTKKNNAPVIDTLEARVMFAGTPVSISTLGNELTINGSAKADAITVTQTEAGLVIGNAGWTTTVTGNYTTIKINGGNGNDKITVDASVTAACVLNGNLGNDILIGGSGNDTFVAIGAGVDQVTGRQGTDSFWTDSKDGILDASAAEANNGYVHKVAAFESIKTTQKVGKKMVTKVTKIGIEPKGEKLIDPATTAASITYKSFKGAKLFSDAGPVADDVAQGYVGDCYYLATLASVADTNANVIEQSVVDLGDGTYAVRFYKGSTQVFVRVDADLPVWSNGQLAYADQGAQNSLWVAVMEKAFAVFRTGANSYQSIEAGWMSEAYASLGKASQSTWSVSTGAELLSIIKTALEAGRSVTYACNEPTDGASLIGSHAYSVERVNADESGNLVSVTLRNPWGIDGIGNDGSNDGYVTVTAAQAKNAFLGLMIASV